MATITKKKLIQVISQKRGVHPNDVRNVIQSFLDAMTEYLAQGDRLEFRDFGVFEIVVRKPKIGRNPKKAGVPIVIPARAAVKFTSGKKMKKLLDEKHTGKGQGGLKPQRDIPANPAASGNPGSTSGTPGKLI